ncbi:MAG: twin-arginine translocase TatA/TatE family subunit [Crocinitomicaceae bacterium]|nr:twin-arginine translocase TatA/TatE family subunit [Crocinitomicaceae bacterium]
MVLFLNDIGTGEVVLVLVFILIFFGSKSIPGLARTFGRTIRQIKDASSDLQSEIKKSSNELKGELNLKEIIDDTARDVRKPLDQYAADIEDVMKRTPTSSVPKQKKVVEAPTAAETVESAKIPEATETPKPPKPPKATKVKVEKPSSPKSEGKADSE